MCCSVWDVRTVVDVACHCPQLAPDGTSEFVPTAAWVSRVDAHNMFIQLPTLGMHLELKVSPSSTLDKPFVSPLLPTRPHTCSRPPSHLG